MLIATKQIVITDGPAFMHTNSKINNIQQNRIKHHAEKANCNKFLDLLGHLQLFTSIEELLPAHRDRCFPPMEMLSGY